MENLLNFLKKYRILIILFFVLVIGLLLFLIASREVKREKIYTQSIPTKSPSISVNPINNSSSKVWQISFSYNTQKQQLSMEKIRIQNGTAHAAPASNAPYVLFVLDKNKNILFKTEITIAQQILYDVYFPPGATTSGLPQLPTLDTLVTIPYFADADSIQIQKNGQEILQFIPPKEISFFKIPQLIQQAEASGTCDLLHIVFVSDGYADMTKFHTDVQKAEATFTSKAPFSSHTEIFDFQTVENPMSNSLGCKTNNALNIACIYTNANLTKISDVVFAAQPQLPHDPTYTKIVVLVDGAPQPFPGGGLILGVANNIGGQFGVFQNQLYFESTATMEVLGHDVGQLYDRYLYPPQPGTASDMGNTIPAPYASNCSTNPQGESFWKSAGVSTAYKGCTSQYMYSPAPRDCGPGGAYGSNSTIMSAAGCTGTQFDGVEQYYLQSVILPRYCKFVPTPTPTLSPMPTLSPTPAHGLDSTREGTTQNTAPTVSSAQTFKCVLDPSCATSRNNLQMCQLKCSPQ